MLLDKTNIEFLKLIAVCKDFPVNCQYPEVSLLSDSNINELIMYGLICSSRDQRRYRLSMAGYELLRSIGFPYEPDVTREANEQALIRREQSAQVMLTMLLAGVNVYADEVSQLSDENRFIHAGTIRRVQRSSGKNLTGNTRFNGLMGNGFVFYYVSNPQSKLYYQTETRIVKALLSLSRRNSPEGNDTPTIFRPTVIYMGESYYSLCSMMIKSAVSATTYRSAFDHFTVPVYLCPCSPDGAVQIRIMLQPEYKQKMINHLFNGDATMPDPDYGICDGLYRGEPFVISVDMDLRRIKNVLDMCRKKGAIMHIYARSSQTVALRAVFPDDCIRFRIITDDEIKSLFGFSSLIMEPPIEPYITPKGGYVDDKTIRDCREARKANRKKDKAIQEENARTTP